MNKLLNTILIMAGLVTLSGCHDRREGVTTSFGEGSSQWRKKLPYDHWRFSFVYPANLPAVVTLAFIEDGDLRETVYHRLDPMDVSDTSIGHWDDVIGGYGGYFNKSYALPVHMFFCWDSVIDMKAYETEVWFDNDTWTQMTVAYTNPYRPGKTYYRNKMLFGLAPGGTVRVWLENNGEKVIPQRSVRLITVSGDKMLRCKGITQHPYGYVYYGKIPEFLKGKTYPYGEW